MREANDCYVIQSRDIVAGAEAVILEGFARILPGVPVVSEEAAGTSVPENLSGEFVLVDPLDGTRELVAGRDEFTINLALLSGGRPQVGIIAAPAQGVLWRGIETKGAEYLRLAPGAPASARSSVASGPASLGASTAASTIDSSTDASCGRSAPSSDTCPRPVTVGSAETGISPLRCRAVMC